MSSYRRDPREFGSFDEAERWSYRSMKELERAISNRVIPAKAFHLAREDVMRTVEEAEKYFRGYKYPTAAIQKNQNGNWGSAFPNSFYSNKSQQMAAYQSALSYFTSGMVSVIADVSKEQIQAMSVEQSFGELTAFRVWRVTGKPELKSSYRDTIWPVGQIMKAHLPPASDTASGLYGWKSVFELAEYSKRIQESARSNYDINTDTLRMSPIDVPTLCIGRVHLWGEVIEHERGYRAEFARIISLDDCIDENGKWDGAGLEKMRELYFPKEQSK